MNKEKLKGLLEVSCCTYHDGLCAEIYDYVINLQQENQQLKKQKNDVVEYIKYQLSNLDLEKEEDMKAKMLGSMILIMLEDNRMLGEIDEY